MRAQTFSSAAVQSLFQEMEAKNPSYKMSLSDVRRSVFRTTDGKGVMFFQIISNDRPFARAGDDDILLKLEC